LENIIQSRLIKKLNFYYFHRSSRRSSNECVSTATNMAELVLPTFVVDENLCYGCGACIALCPTNALELVDRLAIVEMESCTLCEHCIPSCPVFALSIEGVE